MAQLYYGTTMFGHRIHLGDDVLYPDISNPKQWVVVAKCGNRMYSFNVDEPAPSKVDEYCKTCYRPYAWDLFVENMRSRAVKQIQAMKPVSALKRKRKAQ